MARADDQGSAQCLTGSSIHIENMVGVSFGRKKLGKTTKVRGSIVPERLRRRHLSPFLIFVFLTIGTMDAVRGILSSGFISACSVGFVI